MKKGLNFSQIWRLKVQDKGASIVMSGEGSLPGSYTAVFYLCPCRAEDGEGFHS